MKFTVGDRVVVSERYRGAGCNHGAIGYYGHVVRTRPKRPRDPLGPMAYVAFRGHIKGLPATGEDGYYLSFGEDNPFPCYEFELDHAD